MKKKIVVLIGGISGEREVSFLSGKACSKILKKKGYKVLEVDAKNKFVSKIKKFKPSVIFNALHGKFGEDGFVQCIFEAIKIPYTHSGALSSKLAMNKVLSKLLFIKNKIRVPKYIVLKKNLKINLIKKLKNKKIKFPIVINQQTKDQV